MLDSRYVVDISTFPSQAALPAQRLLPQHAAGDPRPQPQRVPGDTQQDLTKLIQTKTSLVPGIKPSLRQYIVVVIEVGKVWDMLAFSLFQ